LLAARELLHAAVPLLDQVDLLQQPLQLRIVHAVFVERGEQLQDLEIGQIGEQSGAL
jgi:hypothetical protein